MSLSKNIHPKMRFKHLQNNPRHDGIIQNRWSIIKTFSDSCTKMIYIHNFRILNAKITGEYTHSEYTILNVINAQTNQYT